MALTSECQLFNKYYPQDIWVDLVTAIVKERAWFYTAGFRVLMQLLGRTKLDAGPKYSCFFLMGSLICNF